MADRYWVGGSGTWNSSNTANWSTSSGGAGGASVPTSGDSVFFDQASTYTVTVSGTVNCASWNISAGPVTFTVTSSTMNIYGNVNWTTSSITFNGTSAITLWGSANTINTSGVTFPGNATTFSACNYTLQSAFTTAVNITFLSNGLLDTNGYSVTTGGFFSFGRIFFRNSTVTITRATTGYFDGTSLTIDFGTSQINLAGSGGTVSAVARNFYNVAITGTLTTDQTFAFTGSNTFNNLSLIAPTTAGRNTTVTFNSSTTINGTLSTTSTAGNRRVIIRSSVTSLVEDLVVNSTPSITDVDFQDIRVIGTAAPISGTRIGDRRGNSGITFSTPKTVYWRSASITTWGENSWADSPGGSLSTDNHPLPQDTAIIDNTSRPSSIALDKAAALPSLNLSGATNALTLNFNSTNSYYGDLTLGSGVNPTGTSIQTFVGRNTQTIITAGKTFPAEIDIISIGGTVQLGDSFTSNSRILIEFGTFDTKNYALTASDLWSSYSSPRGINLGSSAVTLRSGSPLVFNTSGNLSFNAGTSSILLNSSSSGSSTINLGGLTYYNFTIQTTSNALDLTINGNNTFNNLDIRLPTTLQAISVQFSGNNTITGTLTLNSTSTTNAHRMLVRCPLTSSTVVTPVTLNVSSLNATRTTFFGIDIIGTAMGTTVNDCGDMGYNSGLVFSNPKTVYLNASGFTDPTTASNIWATTSGGTPDLSNFPLAQDTIIIDDNSVVSGSLLIMDNDAFGTIDASSRTTALSIAINNGVNLFISKSLYASSSVSFTSNGTSSILFCGISEQVISVDNAIAANMSIFSDKLKLKLNKNLSLGTTTSNGNIQISCGEFDANNYNVTCNTFVSATTADKTVRMGSGTWTLTGTGTVWSYPTAGGGTTKNWLYSKECNIVLSNNTTTARTFAVNGNHFNKLTIGGNSSTSTTTISSSTSLGGSFGELASTKTVAHTISFGTFGYNIGKWSVSGTAGNVVSITGSPVFNIVGARVSNVNYLSLGTSSVSSNSPAEFYAGPNSTGGTGFILTNAPAPTTRYWVGGTATWSTTNTTNWSTSSGGAGGASVPTSADDVVFDSASSASSYTVTCSGVLRCKSMTFSAPASGSATWAGSGRINFHGNVSLPASGLTTTYSGSIVLTGDGVSTITPNGATFSGPLIIDGVYSDWSLGSALIPTGSLSLNSGIFRTQNYNITAVDASISFASGISYRAPGEMYLGSSTLAIYQVLLAGSQEGDRLSPNFYLNAGTSTINLASNNSASFYGGGKTYYNLTISGTNRTPYTFYGENTFNNFTTAGRTTGGVTEYIFYDDQIINGTLTLSATSNASCRHFFRSGIIGQTRSIYVNSLASSAADADFRDMTITGPAAPISGSRFGDCKGNSGITFDSPKNVYWNSANTNWTSNSWSTTQGGAVNYNNFPLAQDTVIFTASSPADNTTITINASYNIGTIDMSSRLSNSRITINTQLSTTTIGIYGNWINGPGTTISGTSVMTFAGRNTQNIVSSGKTFSPSIVVQSRDGTVQLQDSFSTSNTLTLNAGKLKTNGYNLSCSSFTAGVVSVIPRSIEMNSSVWTIISSSTSWSNNNVSNFSCIGPGTVSMTSSSAKTFAGGGVDYSGMTLDQGGNGTLTITGNNTFSSISSSNLTGATSIILGTTFQTITSSWTAKGSAGILLTVLGSTTEGSLGTINYTGNSIVTSSTTNYLNLSNIRVFPANNKWYAGLNSTNNGSYGWVFDSGPIRNMKYGSTDFSRIYYGSTPIKRVFYGSTLIWKE